MTLSLIRRLTALAFFIAAPAYAEGVAPTYMFQLSYQDAETAIGQALVQKGAALMIRDGDVKESLVPAIIALAADEQRQTELTKNISPLGITDADERIADEILNVINISG